MTDERAHWQETYAAKVPERVSWFESRPRRSLELIQAAGVDHDAGILDVVAARRVSRRTCSTWAT